MSKNFGKNISKKLSSSYSQKLLDHAKNSETDELKNFSKRVIQTTAQATRDLIVNKIAGEIKKSSKKNSETVTNENNKKIPKERCISL